MKKLNIDIVTSEEGDWEALYINGRLAVQGHTLAPTEILSALGFVHTLLIVDMHTNELTRFPEHFEDLP